ncbi:MAG: methylenetetrahydrofolate reductase [Chloroflexi bacterium]|nr:methylenetetrahydrofolate reductase [Chloroflexota bacterium]
MAKVIDRLSGRPSGLVIICDFSPPRGSGTGWIEDARGLDADFICVAYSPGKSVRLDSAIAAHLIRTEARKEVIFNLAGRDMNRLAIQSHLLGAASLGLENLVVLQGDGFRERDESKTGAFSRFKPTELIAGIKEMNRGLDYRGRKLDGPTDFCVGGVVDLGKGIGPEARLARRKARAGADFLITQPVHDPHLAERFLDEYRSGSDPAPDIPVFFGVQVLVKGGVLFSDVPEQIVEDLTKGRPGEEIALETVGRLQALGLSNIYLIPPVLKGGARDYAAAQRVISSLR